jgi:hypothetical protein
MKKPILYSLFIFLALSCGSPDDGPPVNPPVDPPNSGTDNPQGGEGNPPVNSNDQITLKLDGVNNFDFSQLTLLTPENEINVGSDGTFESGNSDEENEMPFLFLFNNNALFGYFPSAEDEDTIALDDILYFYFAIYPDLAIAGLPNATIRQSVDDLVDKDKLNSVMAPLLDEGLQPLENEVFMEALKVEVNKLLQIHSPTGKTKSAKLATDLEIKFEREGKITVPERFPFYSAVGMEIKNKTTGQSSFGPVTMKAETFVFSTNSIANFINGFFENDNISTTNLAQLVSEGEYEISFTNVGTGQNTPLNQVVWNANKQYLISQLFGFYGATVKNVFGKAKCANEVTELLNNLYLSFAENELNNNGQVPTKGELAPKILSLSENLLNVGKECLSAKELKHLSKLIPIINIVILASDVNEAINFFEDLIRYNINQKETRYFYKETLFGKLESEVLSEKDFYGVNGDSFEYRVKIEEENTKYRFERNSTNNDFTVEQYKLPGAFLPFKPIVESGDAELVFTSDEITNFDGILSVEAKIKDQNSKIILDPLFFNGPPYPDYLDFSFELKTLNPLLLSTMNLDFGEVVKDQSKELTFQIQNPNPVELDISLSSNNGAFTTGDAEHKLLANETKTIIVTFKPSELLSYSAELEVTGKGVTENSKIQLTGVSKEESNEDNIRTLLQSKNWGIVGAGEGCELTQDDICYDPLYVYEGPRTKPVSCGIIRDVVFYEDGTFKGTLFGETGSGEDWERIVSNTYTVNGNSVAMTSITTYTSSSNGQNQITDISWSLQGMYEENNGTFTLQVTVVDVTNISGGAISCKYSNSMIGNMIMSPQ